MLNTKTEETIIADNITTNPTKTTGSYTATIIPLTDS
jgi:hypothetical protein